MKVLATSLHGTSAADTLTGTSAHELIYGYEGNDTLAGGTGNDTYIYRLNDGQDVISNLTAGTSDIDVLKFGEEVNLEHLFLYQQDTNLVIDFLDSADKVTVQSAFASSKNQIDSIFVGTQVLQSSQISQLLTALSAIEPDPVTAFTAAQRVEIVGVLENYFQPSGLFHQ